MKFHNATSRSARFSPLPHTGFGTRVAETCTGVFVYMWKGVGAGRGGRGVCREGGGAVFVL